MSQAIYLRPLNGDPHGLLAPSPGGGTVPTVTATLDGSAQVLVLRTSGGEIDPIGMARAREVLAQVEGLDPSRGVGFRPSPLGAGWWQIRADLEVRTYSPDNPAAFREVPRLVPLRYVEDGAEALAAILAHLGVCEVVRG